MMRIRSTGVLADGEDWAMGLRAKVVTEVGPEVVAADSPAGGMALIESARPESFVGVVPIGPIKISLLSAEQLTQRLIGHAFGDVTQQTVRANPQLYVLAEGPEDFRAR